jgi:hypothetical protein
LVFSLLLFDVVDVFSLAVCMNEESGQLLLIIVADGGCGSSELEVVVVVVVVGSFVNVS